MDKSPEPASFVNHFLIAMPGLTDQLFARSVVYVCEHSARGALGLIVNKPGNLSMGELFERVDLPLTRPELSQQPVFHGGPVQMERGFVLHERIEAEGLAAEDSIYASTLVIPGGLEMTTSKDVLEALASGGGPRHVLITLGYSAWGEGQLESEIGRNDWLTVAADPDVVFDAPIPQRYDCALRLLGIDARMLVGQAGHA